MARIISFIWIIGFTAGVYGQGNERVELGKLSNGDSVVFVRAGDGAWGLEIGGGSALLAGQLKPAEIEVYRGQNGGKFSAGYASVGKEGAEVVGRGKVFSDGKAAFEFEDRWKVSGAVLTLNRKVTVAEAEEGAGFYSAVHLSTGNGVRWEDATWLVPGLLYGDPSHAGGGSVAGAGAYRAKRFTIREDYLSAPMMGMAMKDGTWAAVMDLAPRGDTTQAESGGGAEAIIDERIGIGAVGASELSGGGLEVGFWLPCTTAEVGGGRGGAGGARGRYHPVKAGFVQSYQVGFRFDRSGSFNEMERDSWRWAWESLGPVSKLKPIDVEMTRTALMDHLSSVVLTVEGRTGIPFEYNAVTGGAIDLTPKIIMGFCGKNLEGADQLLLEGERDPSARGQKMREQGLAIIDTLVRLVPMSPPAGVGYNIQDGKPIPANFVPGFTLRMPAEDLAVLVNTYRREKAAGRDHPQWLQWARDYCDWILTQQREDGSFPAAWTAGTSTVIRDSGNTSYVPVPVLVRMGEATGQRKYVESATKAAEYVWKNFGSKGVYLGATGTGNNIADKESGMLSMEAFLALYENTKEAKWLDRAKAAADYTESWIWIWNVPMAMDANDAALHWKKGVGTIGVNGIGADVIGGVDQYLDWAAPSYGKLYKLTKDEHYLDVAYVLLHGTKAMLALPGRTYDLLGPGWQQEHWSMGPGRKGNGSHRNWLPWISVNHINSIVGLEMLDKDLYRQLSKPK